MKKKTTKLTIIIPAYNEAGYISATMSSLANQLSPGYVPIDPDLYQVVVVDNNSSDNTIEVVKSFSDRMKIHIVKETTKGVVQSRIAGFNYVLNSDGLKTEYLVSGDADVIFHRDLVHSVIENFEQGVADVLSIAGCFPDQFWGKVPKLVDRYLAEIGTVFFSNETIERLNLSGNPFKFTEQIFFDFGRPVSDACFAVTASSYLGAGGYKREFRGDKPDDEVFGEGWRLCFVLEKMGKKPGYVNSVPYTASPRRLLKEPEKFLAFSSYGGKMEDLRNSTQDDYERLNRLAEVVQLAPIQKYILDYYIILRCITRPELIRKNSKYFGDFGSKLESDIASWWKEKKEFKGYELLDLSEELGDKYREMIFKSMPLARVGEIPLSSI